MIEPKDDFEFRPLTEGLGFHKKTPRTPLNTTLAMTPATKELEMSVPLPRRQQNPALNETPASNVDDILSTLNKRKNLDFKQTPTPATLNRTKAKEFLRQEPQTGYALASWDFSASLLDAMLIIASSLACVIILMLVTQVDLAQNLAGPQADPVLYLALLMLFAGVSWIYLVVTRVFLGQTPGEWVFDQRLGRPEDMKKSSFAPLVALRSLIVVATGFFLFPLISTLFNRDLLGKWLGIELMKKS